MELRRITTEGLSHHSYFLADGGEAVVIDPRRDVDVYLDLARETGARIRTILETHRNEDYVIGSTALADVTGAAIRHGAGLDFGYGEPIEEGDEVACGRLRLGAVATPGHTPESMTYTLVDTKSGKEPVIAFTGDALFVGDAGRTDLWGSEEEAAAHLHASLFEKILPLGDHVVLRPAHGGGSVCGGAILDRDDSTLGYERRSNPALEHRERDDFVRFKAGEKHVRPLYFQRMEEWNQHGNAPIHHLLPVPPPLSAGELAERMEDGVPVVDLRMPQAFASGHVPGSLNVWQDGVAGYLPWTVEPGKPFLLVLPDDADPEDVTRTLLRIGYDDFAGYLRGGFETWQNEGRELGRLGTIDTGELRERLDEVVLVDVRQPGEWDEGGVEGARRIFVGHLGDRLDDLPKDAEVVTMCSVGHRGGLAASVLARHGFPKVRNYLGGYTAWKKAEKGS